MTPGDLEYIHQLQDQRAKWRRRTWQLLDLIHEALGWKELPSPLRERMQEVVTALTEERLPSEKT